jgi:hypothetical protein
MAQLQNQGLSWIYAKAKTVRHASHAIYHSSRVISNVPLDLPNRASFLGELALSAN